MQYILLLETCMDDLWMRNKKDVFTFLEKNTEWNHNTANIYFENAVSSGNKQKQYIHNQTENRLNSMSKNIPYQHSSNI
jgi:hypothetical protein